MSLKKKAVKSSISMLSGQMIKFLLNIASITILARLLSPDDYGLVAIATSVTAVLETFREAGLSTATLQRPQLSQVQLSSMHWVNVGLGAGMFLVILLISPLIGSLYEREQLQMILPCYGLIGLISSFGVQRAAMLQRTMEFRRLVIADVSSLVIGVGVGILAASNGWKYWSLIAMQAATIVAYNIGLMLSSRWRPDYVYDHQSTKPLLSFGVSIMASNVLGRTLRGLDALTIGYFLSTGAVGIYNRAQSILNRPMDQFISPVMNVARALVFRTTGDPQKFSFTVAALIALISFGSALLVLVFLNFAGPIVLIVLGEKWLECIPIFIALTPFAFVEPCASFLSSVLVSKGDAAALLKFRMISGLIIVAGLAIGLRWGLIGIAVSYGLSGLLIRMPLFMYYTCRKTGISFAMLGSYMLPNLLGGICAALLPLYHQIHGHLLSPRESGVQFIVSMAIFFTVVLLFPRGRKLISIAKWILLPHANKASLSDVLLS